MLPFITSLITLPLRSSFIHARPLGTAMNYDELFIQTKSMLLHDLPNNLASLDRAALGLNSLDGLDQVRLSLTDSTVKVQTVANNCDRLSGLLSSLQPVSRRSQMRFSLDELRHDCKHFRACLQAAERRISSKERELRERDELLRQDFTTNASRRNIGQPSSNQVVVNLANSEAEHHSRLSAVGRRLDEMLSTGAISLTSLKDQGLTLKNAQRRTLDLINTLGLSNTVMRLIERRTHQDKVIFWLLVSLTLFLMWAIWRFFH